MRQAPGGREELPGKRKESTAVVLRETAKKVFGVSGGQRKETKEMWW